MQVCNLLTMDLFLPFDWQVGNLPLFQYYKLRYAKLATVLRFTKLATVEKKSIYFMEFPTLWSLISRH
ncbi:MAG: hypothetical protein ACI8P3_001081 [Saprospiraceae bacterium]|jgi:hypothetical protein